MAIDYIRYDILIQEAMRGVVRTVLKDAAAKGLPGEHHFYISFDTRAPGVKLSPRLRAQYAEEMTIVLQHQFWDLSVTDETIEVGLSFNGIPERLTVPLAAIREFLDPSVKFGLKFADVSDAGKEAPAGTSDATPKPAATQDRGPSAARPPEPAPAPALPATDSEPDKPAGAEVVRLDRFRKK
jgi:uncharacterized protein